MSNFYANAPVYETIVETLFDLTWRNLRGQVTEEEIRERYLLAYPWTSIVDLYCPLDALVRLGYSEAEAEQMLRDEDLEELI